MMLRRHASYQLVLLCLLAGLASPSWGWAQAMVSNGAIIGGKSIPPGYVMAPGQSGTLNYPGQLQNYTFNYDVGTNPAYDATAFFKRPDPNTSGIPPGWNGIPGVINDCKSSIEEPPGAGSWFMIRIYDLNHHIVLDQGYPPDVQWCFWQDASKGGHIDIWDQGLHPVNNANGPKWAPGPPTVEATNGKKDVDKKEGGDPVDLGTGLFILEHTDVAIPDLLPIALTRTYRQLDTASRAFGIGATHPYDLYLMRDNQCTVMQLILPDGARETYTRTSGTDCFTASLVNTTSPTAAQQATLNWDSARQLWNLRRKSGTVYRFSSMSAYARLLLMEIEDRNGNRMTLLRDSLGRLSRVISPSTKFLQFTYDASDRITQVVDNSGRTVGYTYDASGRLWKVTDPKTGVTEYTYDAAHRMLTIKDARGIVFLTNTYDANGRVLTQTQADNTTYQFAYTLDGNGKVTQTDVTDPRGYVRRVTFDSSGYPLTETLALGQPEAQTTTYTRQTGTNLVLSVTDALNRETAYTYDAKGNVASVTRLAGTGNAATTTLTYDPTWSQLTSMADPLNHTTTFAHDGKGNLTGITDALNQTTTMTVNAAGQPLTITNPLNQITTFTYDLGELTGTTDPLNRTTTRFVDSLGRLLALTPPRGDRTTYDVDALNRVTQITDAINGLTGFSYDANGNLLTVTDAKSQATTYTYNNMDRLATRQDALLKTETYVYDNNGNLTTVTDRKNQVTTYTYDALNRRKTATYQDGSTTMYTYDAGNRLTQIVDSLSGTITRTYDNLDRLTQEVTPEGTINYTYDAASRRSSMTVAGQPAMNYTYDNANRLTQITQGTSTVTMAYDNAGRRTSLTLPTGTSITYTYDTASQLTALTYQQGATLLGTLAYTYDNNGNRLKQGGTWAGSGLPQPSGTITVNANNQMVTFGNTTLTYDFHGNMTSATDSFGTATYTWDARNRMTGITATGLAASFTYDPLGRRVNKTINGTVTRFLYDGLNPVQELSASAVTANLLTGLGIDEYFTRTDAAGSRGYLNDALGSTRALVDNTGAVQTSYTYEPFGNTTTNGVASTNAFQYTGRENDGTGLYYYRARYYNPRLQRFTSEDPIGFSGGINKYAYVQNDPMRFNDPLGLEKHSSPPPFDPEDPTHNPLCFLPGIECGVPPEFLPIIPGIGGTTGRGNIENLGNKEANGIAKEQGYRNAEDFKNGVVGKDAKNYNMAVDKGTGEIILTPVQKGGGPNVPTNMFRK